jgi:hypothetical protein
MAENKTAEDIREMQHEIDRERRNYLRRSGWTEDSQYPGCFWLWSKTVTYDGRTRVVACGESQAFSIQEAIDLAAAELEEARGEEKDKD